MNESNESLEFWKTKKEEAGKDIVFKSFTRFLGESGKSLVDLSGLLYTTNDVFYFEDFEKSSMFSFFAKKKKTEYEKFTMNFPFTEISQMKRVTESSAIACIKGKIPNGIAPGILGKLTKSIIWEFELKSNVSYFFEIFEYKKLLKLINHV